MLVEKVGNVTLTEVAGSSFLYVRYRKNGKPVSRSLKTADVAEAREMARQVSDSMAVKLQPAKADISFTRFANEVIARDQKKVDRGERSERIIVDQKSTLKRHCSQTLGSLSVKRITHAVLDEFVDELTDKELSSATIKKTMVFVNKVMTAAVRAGVISHVPLQPQVSLKSEPRGWFSVAEYKRFLQACRKHEKLGTKVRTQPITPELRWMCTFMVNTFMRPGDIKLLRNRHVEIASQGETRYLRITTDTSKTTLDAIVSMPVAIPIYERLLKAAKASGYGKPDDYVFMPNRTGRAFVLRTFSDQFRKVVEDAGLRTSPSGQVRTLYSLRHTAIMFRLLKGNVDTLTLARSARTSVEMIDRFYAKHLTAEMNVEKLHSMR